MRLRSMLFVPGDSERKFVKGAACGADALILDLEDAVTPAMKPTARAQVAGLISDRSPRDWAFFVRVNPLQTGLTHADLAAVVRPGLDGIVVPKADGAADVETIANDLEALEIASGMDVGSVKIVVVATETPQAMFNLGSYTPPHPRLAGLTWGAEDLSAAIGATTARLPDGAWTSPYVVARALCLFAAASAGVAPLETLYADYRDSEGLAADCAAARRDGFTGRIAIHPDQVPIINAGFTPSPADLDHARRVVRAFADQPDAGTVGIDGKMYDRPHLTAAEKTLAAAGEG
ncbi:MAG TPA: CoA ester lyase [Caulobacteraceae bacterium]|jgi:citrate lyase subunit beta/citryl-CoA lyase|nr:CoA ester lyase [Caulobacteraceae bacterium]